MPGFSANITTLFRELPLMERLGAAADADFDAIEIQSPYTENSQALKAEIDRYDLKLVLMNFPVRNKSSIQSNHCLILNYACNTISTTCK